jgi:hypothetical protein
MFAKHPCVSACGVTITMANDTVCCLTSAEYAVIAGTMRLDANPIFAIAY